MQKNKIDFRPIGKIILLAILFTSFSIGLSAQKKDTLQTIRDFMEVCNVYKQMPLHLELEVYNTTNLIRNPEDTASLQGEFYITSGDSYIKFGEIEQLVNDSTALLVSDKLQRMILFLNAQAIRTGMKALAGVQLQDSSLALMGMKYKTRTNLLTNEESSIELIDRSTLYGTSLPKETIEIQFDVKTKTPAKVITIKRTLLPIEQKDFDALSMQAAMTDKLLKLEKEYYLIREQISTFVYKTVGHEANIKIPATIADRIKKNENGEFAPVKEYEKYAITIN